jgi:hypothetical protein
MSAFGFRGMSGHGGQPKISEKKPAEAGFPISAAFQANRSISLDI